MKRSHSQFEGENFAPEAPVMLEAAVTAMSSNTSIAPSAAMPLPIDGAVQEPPLKKQQTEVPKVKDALAYLEKVRSTFTTKPEVYNNFLEIMKEFKSQKIDTDDVIKRVKELFRGHRGLILGFNQFLPPGYKVELPADKPKPTNEFNNAVLYVGRIKARFRDQPHIYSEFLDILHDYQARRTIDEVYTRVQKLFSDHLDLLEEFRYFLPDSGQYALGQPPDGNGKAKKQKSKVGGRANNKKRKSDMAMERRELAAYSSKSKTPKVTYPPGTERELQLFERIKSNVHKTIWNQFIRALNIYSKQIITRAELMTMIEDIFSEDHVEYIDKLKSALHFDESSEVRYLTRTESSYFAFLESDALKSMTQPTPSYRELPPNLPVPMSSTRTPLADEVLNDRCISIPMGSEESTFKTMRHNTYAEALNTVEDERFELDLVIENNRSAMSVLTRIVNAVQNMSSEQGRKMKLPKNVDILHLRAIARVYGDHGYEVVELLRRSPSTSAPIILKRLKQKDVEWRKLRLEMKEVWRKTTEANYNKSLDHRSYYFKSDDKRRLTFRGLVQEFRDINNLVFGEGIDSESDVFRRLVGLKVPTPLYSYSIHYQHDDLEIHQYIYDLIAGCVLRQCTEREQAMFQELWSTFVLHLFGLQGHITLNPQLVAVQREVEEVDATKTEHEADEDSIDNESMMLGSSEGRNQNASPASSVALTVDDMSKSNQSPSKKQQSRRGRIMDEASSVEQKLDAEPNDGAAGSDDVDEISVEDPQPSERPVRRDLEDFGNISGSFSVLRCGDKNPFLVHSRIARKDSATGNQRRLNIEVSSDYDMHPIRKHERPSNVFIGTMDFFVLLRLYQLLYERLSRAKSIANNWKPKNTAKPENQKKKKKKNGPTSPTEAYDEFKRLLDEYLVHLNQNKFEDDLRQLFGAQTYVLFTLDRLVQAAMQHTLSVASDSDCDKIISLYFYESARANNARPITLEMSAQLNKMYLFNFLATADRAVSTQIEVFLDTNEMGFALLDNTPAEGTTKVSSSWKESMTALLTPTQSYTLPEHHSAPFLARNVANQHQRTADGGKKKSPFENLEFYNSLEQKIGLRRQKSTFNDGSFDFLFRHATLPSDSKSLDEARQRKANMRRSMYHTTQKLNSLFLQKFPDHDSKDDYLLLKGNPLTVEDDQAAALADGSADILAGLQSDSKRQMEDDESESDDDNDMDNENDNENEQEHEQEQEQDNDHDMDNDNENENENDNDNGIDIDNENENGNDNGIDNGNDQDHEQELNHHMIDLVAGFHQYQDATADEEGADGEAGHDDQDA